MCEWVGKFITEQFNRMKVAMLKMTCKKDIQTNTDLGLDFINDHQTVTSIVR